MTVLNRSVNLLLALALLSSDVGLAEQSARYVGRVAVEWVDDSESGQPMKLLDEFSFVDARGTAWIVPGGQIVDGKSLPPAFRSLFGAPFIGRHRRAAVVHDYYAGQRRVAWRDVHRMFHEAAVAAGVSRADAKTMYMAVYAQGPRWEPKEGSRCYNSCHAAAPSLAWRPVVSENDLRPVVEWIEQNDPDLPEIEQRVDAATKKPGPHLFAQGH
jgi:Protein of unknown function (DUF1353)